MRDAHIAADVAAPAAEGELLFFLNVELHFGIVARHPVCRERFDEQRGEEIIPVLLGFEVLDFLKRILQFTRAILNFLFEIVVELFYLIVHAQDRGWFQRAPTGCRWPTRSAGWSTPTNDVAVVFTHQGPLVVAIYSNGTEDLSVETFGEIAVSDLLTADNLG